jgi:cytoskeleton protein RodZ
MADDQEIELTISESVGERLQQAREEKKLTVLDVATQLRLVRESVLKLENNQWDDLHGRAYARGYFISYVRFLSLPEEEMLAAFNREYKTSSPEGSSLLTPHVASTKSFPWGLFALIILLAVLLWFAYQQWLQYDETTVGGNNIQSSQQEMTPSPDEPFSSVVEATYDEVLDEAVEEPMTSDDINDVAESETIISETEIPSEQEQIIEQDSDNLQNSELQDETTDNNPTEPSIISVGLQFSDDCWVKVSDADDKTLLNKIMLANTSITLEGKAPFSVSLGRAEAATVTVNNAVFDISPYVQGNVARFSLGENS